MRYLFLSLLVTALPFAQAAAETPEEKGLSIIQEADRRDTGFQDSKATAQMILRNRNGDESVRDMEVSILEVNGDGDKSLTVFDKPPDIKNTALLTYSHATEPDDQWIFLPAIKRVKRISSKNKSGPFVGSEFAYEDMSSQEVEKYTYKWLRDEACGDLQCFVVEAYPAYEHSGYTRLELWIDQQEYRPQKIVYYDRKNDLLKTQTLKDYRQYLDKFWRAHEILMENHQTGKSTTLKWSDYTFRSGLSEGDFSRNALKRAR